MRRIYIVILMLLALVVTSTIYAQRDSSATFTKPVSTTKVNNDKEILLDTVTPKKASAASFIQKDSVIKQKHDPHKATRRSAIIPGWGQAYNREYWKIPIVYGALAVPASLFVYNNNWYQRTKKAYDILVTGGDTGKIYPKLKGIDAANLQYYRNSFRQNRDYSTLFFFLVWGLNVVDATVFAHLKDFDVSSDLSMHVEPDYNPVTRTPALSVALNLKDKQTKILPADF